MKIAFTAVLIFIVGLSVGGFYSSNPNSKLEVVDNSKTINSLKDKIDRLEVLIKHVSHSIEASSSFELPKQNQQLGSEVKLNQLDQIISALKELDDNQIFRINDTLDKMESNLGRAIRESATNTNVSNLPNDVNTDITEDQEKALEELVVELDSVNFNSGSNDDLNKYLETALQSNLHPNQLLIINQKIRDLTEQ